MISKRLVHEILIKMKKILALALLAPTLLQAESPALQDIDQSDLDNITREVSANFTHTTVAPAKALGKYLGLELGAFGGATHSPQLGNLVHEVAPKSDLGKIYHGGLLGMLSIPLGFTLEYTTLPVRRLNDIEVKSHSGAIRWTLTHYFDKLPVHLAVKGHFSNSKFSYQQRIQNTSTANIPVDANIVFDNEVRGGSAILSAHLFFLEPYVGGGVVQGDSSAFINASLSSATIFAPGMSTLNTQHAKSKVKGSHLFGGLHLDFWFVHMGLEYSRILGTDKVTGKFSLAI